MDAITFRYLISLVVSEKLDMRLMDVITAYLYGKLDTDIYMKVPEGLKLPETTNKPQGYINNVICPCVFIKKSNYGFAIVAVYVDDMNLVGTPKELNKTVEYLKSEFEMKDLGKTKYCLSLQIEHCVNGILVHQSAYIEKILKRFGMDKAYPFCIPMVIHSLDIKKDPFNPKEDDETAIGP
ncbi:hypothetical protein COP1_043796 [Malus domestica]